MFPRRNIRSGVVLVAIAGCLAGCAGQMVLSDRDCLTRAMYFESSTGSPEGQLAVGTTVMNRLETPGFPKSVCGVVGQPRQYADGVLRKPMNSRAAARIAEVADAVLAGQRHPQMSGNTLFFHTAGLTYPYRNMRYVLVAGGNAFYEKMSRAEMAQRDAEARPPFATASRAAASRDTGAPTTLFDVLFHPKRPRSPLVRSAMVESERDD